MKPARHYRPGPEMCANCGRPFPEDGRRHIHGSICNDCSAEHRREYARHYRRAKRDEAVRASLRKETTK